ncbi:hypothetical protein M408DRAFT_145719 [Serendipita vermifera MAFF 305830]|uniref:Uncharacterized protein n=1 Tax=Serendipita vermifera MAFF 305830 TaxID=933852 RepID=A0A0C3AJK3_SERVB|nr:hypothetical protein M408DRAFT_145719 [Serendipita vermifera MAFF 305830]
MSSGETDTLLDHQVVPSTPTPSTSDISISQQQHQQLQQQEIKQAFKVPDVLYSIVFSILWLFGLARVSLIPYASLVRPLSLLVHPSTRSCRLHRTGLMGLFGT